MRTGDTRTSKKEVETMRKMSANGRSLSEIGRIFKRDHSTTHYWIKQFPNKLPKDKPITDISIRKRIIAYNQAEKKRAEEIINRINTGKCLVCGKEKDEKWKRTDFCGIVCWEYKPNKSGI